MSDINSEGNGFLQTIQREIKPHPKQEDLISLPDEIFEALYGGAAYGGKSFILTLLPIIRGWYKYNGFRAIMFRRKFPDMERENIRLSKEYFPSTGAVYNETKHTWHWPAYNSYFDFGHIQHAKNMYDYDSAQYNYAFYDELTHFEGHSYFYIVGSRVRPSSAGCNIALVRNGTNPGGIGQSFVYDRFVKPNENGGVIIRDKGTGLYRTFIKALLQDNPSGLEYDPDYANKLKLLAISNPAEYKAKAFGDWHAFKGSVFTTFRPIRFPGEPNNALHVIEPFNIPEWWPRILSIDWGKRAMCHAMWAAISPDKRLFIYREKAWMGRDIPYWASEIREVNDESRENIAHCVICGSAWQERGTETVADQFQRYSNLVPNSSENTQGSRIAGLQTIHDFLRFESKIPLRSKEAFYDLDKASWIFRNYGTDALLKYRQQFFDEPDEGNIPILQIFNTCNIVIDTIPLCIYNDDKGNPEDIQQFDGDDPIDNLRYLCKTARKFIDGELGIDMEMAVKRQKALAELDSSKDMTKFYRQMEMIEHGKGMIHIPGVTTVPNGGSVMRRSRFARRRMH